ncbi:hypothetical protein JGI1_02084 [Candidatus Thermokryptus mobilis]|uniref:6-bladed beta-propeller protein n=2 Tax=Candidatus Thermokryptus mobilis TaxID=1643428 RepID=A0A0S4NAU2_9BACT|nr:hypothetical protein JGI1_02084 [Candidatus Thermokryptus mobilis]
MMMKSKKAVIFILLIFLFFLFALSRLFNFHFIVSFGGEQDKNVKLSEVVKFVKSIRIKNNGKDFLDYDIVQSIAYIDSFLVICNRSQGKIWVLDSSGNVLRIFGGVGSGPGEFKAIQGFDLSKDGLIYIYDHINARFTVYNLRGELVKVFQFSEPGLIIKHIAVDDSGRIFVHHPPSARHEYSGFLTLIYDDGKVKETYTEDIDWGYQSYFYRGFLGGDLIISSGYVVEANDFTGVTLHKVDSKEKINFEKPKGLWSEIKRLRTYSVDTLEKAYDARLWGLIEHSGVVMVHYYSSKKKMPKGSYGYFLLYNLDGRYLGKVVVDLPVIMHRGDLRYLVVIEPNIQDSKLDEKVPYVFNIYEWDLAKLGVAVATLRR